MDRDDPKQEVTKDERGGAGATTKWRLGGVRYMLGAPIGRGGMGEVVAAFDAQIGREVAIKRMLDDTASDLAMTRFFREASVPVYELGVDEDGRPFFAMKKLAGTTLKELIRADRSRQHLLRAFVDVCLAVEFAHTRGVVHRDIKPQNIVLGDFGDVYVLDWGVAKVRDDEDAPSVEPEPAGDVATRAGAQIGTLSYMAPEQLEDSRDVDARADVYSLGCVLFEILAGEGLHSGRGRSRPVDARPSLRAPSREVPPELDEACLAATAPRFQRIATARELGERVQAYLDGDRDLARRQELARAHLATARDAFDRGEETERGIAIREAGRALALDPTLPAAGSLVGRLILELPTRTPPEVAEAIHTHEVFTIRAVSRASAWAFTGFLWLLPAILAMAPRHPTSALAIVVAVSIMGALIGGGGIGTVGRSIRLACGSVLLVGVLSWVLSPVIAAPGIATVIAIALTTSPNYRRWWPVLAVAAAMCLAVLAPWLVQLAGGSPATSIEFVGASLVVTGPGLDVISPIRGFVLALSVIGPVVAAACLGHAMHRADAEVRRRLHLQAWQLGQLVADVETR
jgi:serine/threonine-protein kinase